MAAVRTPYRIDWNQAPWEAGVAVCRRLYEAGYMAVLVGGCVRDLLLGRPVSDIDVATDADPDSVLKLFDHCLEVGKQFGVIVVLAADGQQIEVASFRSDDAYIDGRRPSGISPASEAVDMSRRDFTINALVLDPNLEELRDHVGGLQDIESRQLRVVGDPLARLQEDRLRVLRGFRFAAQLHLDVVDTTWTALCRTKTDGLSRERIWAEWDKAMLHPSRARWWSLLIEAKQQHSLFAELASCRAAELQAVAATLERLPDEADPVLGCAAICSLLPVPALRAQLKTEPISRRRARQLLFLLEYGRQKAWQEADLWTRQGLIADADADLLLSFLQAHAPDWSELPGLIAWREREIERPFTLHLDAKELLASGLAPGAHIGRLLRRLGNLQLQGDLTDADAVKAWLQSLQNAGDPDFVAAKT